MDVMDEVPAGGRLTRSLRKRLTSVDSEASSSRPGTPIAAKLSSVTEQNSPSRSTRSTRRNSVTNVTGTPVKTPSKTPSSRTVASRLEIKSEVNSPLRRINRRHSVSITGDEGSTAAAALTKTPKIEVVPEEDVVTSVRRVTRSASKSPLQPTIAKEKHVDKSSSQSAVSGKRSTRAGPKSKTQARNNSIEQKADSESEVEVIDLDTDDENIAKGSSNVEQTKGGSPKQPTKTEKKTLRRESCKSISEHKKLEEEVEMQVDLENSPPTKSPQISPQKSSQARAMTVKIEKMAKSPKMLHISKTELTSQLIIDLDSESPTVEVEEKNESIHEIENNQAEIELEEKEELKSPLPTEASLKSVADVNINDHHQTDNEAAELPSSPKGRRNSSVIITEVIALKSLSPEAINDIIEKDDKNIKNKNIPDKLKSVGFNDSIEEDASKSSYPKTPFSTRSKSYIELDSSSETIKDKSFTELRDNVKEQENRLKQQDHPIQTPIKSIAKLKGVQSSTPLLNSATEESPAKVAANIEEEIKEIGHIDDGKESPLESPKKSYSLHHTSLAGTPLSAKNNETSPAKSPKVENKSQSNIEKTLPDDDDDDNDDDDDERETIALNTSQLSTLKEKTPEKQAVSPIKLETEISEQSTSPIKSPRDTCDRKGLEPLVDEDADEEKNSSNIFKENNELPKQTPSPLKVTRKKSLNASQQSPRKMMLRSSPQEIKSSTMATSLEANEKTKSTNKITTPLKATETTEKETIEPNKMQSPNAATTFASSWSLSVSGTSNNSKIDKIIAEKESTPPGTTENINETQQESPKRPQSEVISEDNGDNNDGEEDDDDAANENSSDEEEELADNEKAYNKHDFILGEAMEVDDDYQSGDSMNSDERQEMEDNEIPCDGESIGSKDTSDDNDDDEDENDSFIANDSEEEESLLDYSDDEEETEHLLEVERKNKKNLKKNKYRRILRVDDDDDDDDASDVEKIDSVDCLNKSSSSEAEEIGILINHIGAGINDNIKNNKICNKKNTSKTTQVLKNVDLNTTTKVDEEELQESSENLRNKGTPKEKRKSLQLTTSEKQVEEHTNRKEEIMDNKNKDKAPEDQQEDQDLEVQNEANTNHNNDDDDDDDEDMSHVVQKHKDEEDATHRDNNDEKDKDHEDKDQDDRDCDNDENEEEVVNDLNPNSSKLSETVSRLNATYNEDEESSVDSSDNNDKSKSASTKNLNTSRKNTITKMKENERFNKTVHDFRVEDSADVGSDSTTSQKTSGKTESKTKMKRRAVSLGVKMDRQQRAKETATRDSKSSSSEDESQQNSSTRLKKRCSLNRSKQNVVKQSIESSNKNESRLSEKSSPIKPESNVNDDEGVMASNGNMNSSSDSEENITKEEHQKLKKSKCKKTARKSSSALSVSLGYVKECHKSSPKNQHSSFTIGVVVRNAMKQFITTPEPHSSSESSKSVDNKEDVTNIFKVNATDAPSSDNENVSAAAAFSSAEEEQLEKLLDQEDTPLSTGLNSSAVYTHQSTESITDFKNSSKQRRTISIPADYGDFTTSQSFIESVAAEKRGGEFVKSQSSVKRKRLSKSFCAGAPLDVSLMEEVHLNKKSKLGGVYEPAVNSSTPRAEEKGEHMELDKNESNVCEDKVVEPVNSDKKKASNTLDAKKINEDTKQRVLNRCEEILEAANRAKLEAKLNSNKNKEKLLKKKKSKKTTRVKELQLQHKSAEKETQVKNTKLEETETKITPKELKQQEKAKLEIEKALKASANLILGKTEKKQALKNMAMQQLSKTTLDELDTSSSTTSSTKENQPKQTAHSKTEKKIHKTSAGDVLEMQLDDKKTNGALLEEIKLSTGTVRVEPITPTKHLIRSGFRESPMTPLSLGYKVRHILTAGQDTPPAVPAKERKRKRNIEEPAHTLPKPQWTKSGVFIEEEIFASAPISSSGGSTKFTVSALNGVRRKKKLSKSVDNGGIQKRTPTGTSTVTNSALQFKNNALFRSDIQRESSRELIHRKQRKNI